MRFGKYKERKRKKYPSFFLGGLGGIYEIIRNPFDSQYAL